MQLRGKLFDRILDLWKDGQTETQILNQIDAPHLASADIRRLLQRARARGDRRAVRRGAWLERQGRLRYKKWTAAENESVLALAVRGKTPRQIGAVLNRSVGSVEAQLEQLLRARKATAEIGIVPPCVSAERERRIDAMPRDLTGLILGDPPIGFSALEKRATAPVGG